MVPDGDIVYLSRAVGATNLPGLEHLEAGRGFAAEAAGSRLCCLCRRLWADGVLVEVSGRYNSFISCMEHKNQLSRGGFELCWACLFTILLAHRRQDSGVMIP